MVGRSVARRVLGLSGAPAFARVSAVGFSRTTDTLYTLGCPPRRTQRAFQVPLSTPGTGELFVAFGLGLCTVTAGNGCATGRLWYYALGWETFFVILVAAVDGVMSLQKVSVRWSATRSVRPRTERRKEHGRNGRLHTSTYRRAKLIWQVKHLNGFTLVSIDHKRSAMGLSPPPPLSVGFEQRGAMVAGREKRHETYA